MTIPKPTNPKFPLYATNEREFVRIVQPSTRLTIDRKDMILCEAEDQRQWFIPVSELKEAKV